MDSLFFLVIGDILNRYKKQVKRGTVYRVVRDSNSLLPKYCDLLKRVTSADKETETVKNVYSIKILVKNLNK